ncbi:MAG: lysophospholipid acyltransferase family protein [Promethearchaeota archaeon]
MVDEKAHGGKKSRYKNPVMEFLTTNLFKPVDSALDGLLRAVEGAGLTQHIQYPYYLSQDHFWWNVGRIFYNYEIIGSENIPPDGTPAVVCVNHQSMFDPLLYGVAVTHYSRRILHIMAKIELFNTPLVNAYIRWIYAFPVRRGEHDVKAFEIAMDFLRRGELVGMYPEGTLNGGGLNFLPPKVGAAKLAVEAKVPIIPVGLTGPEKIFPKGARTPNFNQKLTAQIGEPITIHEKYFEKEASHDELMGVMEHVMGKIKGLLLY